MTPSETRFSPNEVLEVAVQIERNGAEFYRKVQNFAPDTALRTTLEDLALMEDGHIEIFEGLKKKLTGGAVDTDWYDPDDTGVKYLWNFANGQIFDLTRHPFDFLPENPDIVDVLNIALQREKDSVLFYSGLLNVLPEDWDKEVLNKVVEEEMRHVVLISDKLSTL